MSRALLIVSVLLLLALFGLYKQVQANGDLISRITAKDAQIKAGEELIAKERNESAAASLRAQQYFEQRAKDDEELEALRKCRADKSCWPRVRVKTACPVPGATTDAGAPESTAAEITEDAERSLQRLEGEIKQITTGYLALQDEVKARSAPDFCQPK